MHVSLDPFIGIKTQRVLFCEEITAEVKPCS